METLFLDEKNYATLTNYIKKNTPYEYALPILSFFEQVKAKELADKAEAELAKAKPTVKAPKTSEE